MNNHNANTLRNGRRITCEVESARNMFSIGSNNVTTTCRRICTTVERESSSTMVSRKAKMKSRQGHGPQEEQCCVQQGKCGK